MTVRLNQSSGVVAGSESLGGYSGLAVLTKRGVLLRDSLLILILFLATVALFGMTWFLFKSFESHREDLGRRWSQRGRTALRERHADQAADALRIALSYNPDDRTDQLLLAQSLAESGHTDAATNYFLSLRDTQPGDGFVNLQLARLARKRGDARQAINYYRASIFGNWEGDGAQRRREVRLELADYLAQRGQMAAAKVELLIAAGNAPEKEAGLQIDIADRLAGLGDLTDALHFYQVAVAGDPHNPTALEKAGRTAFTLADYSEAARLLGEAAEAARRTDEDEQNVSQLEELAEQARRAPELSLSRDLPAEVRAQHVVAAGGIAEERLRHCMALHPQGTETDTADDGTEANPVLQALKARWADEDRSLNGTALEHDSALEDSITQLIDDTEAQTAKLCGAPTRDDEVLLMLASRAGGGGE